MHIINISLLVLNMYLKKLNKKAPSQKISPSEKDRLLLKLENFVNKCHLISIDSVENDVFLDIWITIHKLLPNLHPESISDNGNEISVIPSRKVSFCLEPYFLRSGWPIELLPIALEAQKRYKVKKISVSDYFHL